MRYLTPLSVFDRSSLGMRVERVVRVFGITVFWYKVDP